MSHPLCSNVLVYFSQYNYREVEIRTLSEKDCMANNIFLHTLNIYFVLSSKLTIIITTTVNNIDICLTKGTYNV